MSTTFEGAPLVQADFSPQHALDLSVQAALSVQGFVFAA